jgi:YidC/Oxa1 family membrane protein insertase
MDIKYIFNHLLIYPFINLLLVFYNFFVWLKIPGPLGWSIIAMTIAIRGALQPLTKKQMDSAYKMQELKPELDKLTKKYKNDKVKLQQEQMRLYKERGINPASGCLPVLLQFPILIALYQVFALVLATGGTEATVKILNQIAYIPALQIESLDLSFLWMNLASKPSDWKSVGIWILAVPVITGLLQYFQTKLMTPSTANPRSKQETKEKNSSDMASDIQKQMAYMMPIMIGFFAYTFPLGLSLYWNTFSVFSILTMRRKGKKKEDSTSLLSNVSNRLKLPSKTK